jgi:alanine-glyoxylate transaminase / (R)-3-amino-2-methylpropionate-pyruvate transaminase
VGPDDLDAGKKYAADVKNLIDYGTSGRVAAFIAESIQGVGGCIVFPDNYLKHVYEHVRAAGGLCIADEGRQDLVESAPIIGDLKRRV